MVQIGERLQQARERKGLTQNELGERIGRTQKMVSRYETNYTPISLELLVMFAKELDVSADWLLGLSSETEASMNAWQSLSKEARQAAELVNKQAPEDQSELLRLIGWYVSETLIRRTR